MSLTVEHLQLVLNNIRDQGIQDHILTIEFDLIKWTLLFIRIENLFETMLTDSMTTSGYHVRLS